MSSRTSSSVLPLIFPAETCGILCRLRARLRPRLLSSSGRSNRSGESLPSFSFPAKRIRSGMLVFKSLRLRRGRPLAPLASVALAPQLKSGMLVVKIFRLSLGRPLAIIASAALLRLALVSTDVLALKSIRRPLRGLDFVAVFPLASPLLS